MPPSHASPSHSSFPRLTHASPLHTPRYFPIFMKYITGGFVGEEEAGMRLFQVAHDPRCSKSGVYWSWNGGPREGRDDALNTDGQISGGGGARGGWDSIYENDQSDKVLNVETAADLWKYSTQVTGAKWPPANQPKSPCPTLVVVGSITQMMNAKQEAKRFTPAPGNVAMGAAGTIAGVAGTVVDTAVGGTLGAGLKFAQSRLLGDLPEEAKQGSFQEELPSGHGARGGKRQRIKALWRKVLRKGPTAEQLAEAKAAEEAEEAAAIAEILEREQREQEAQQLLAHKVDAALAGGLKVSSKEDATA